MAKNVSLAGRRELHAHRRWISGVTASTPRYQEVDSAGNKEWVVDVYIGPLEYVEKNIVLDVPIAPYARHLVGDIKQPVLLERSKQGKYTVVGRTKTLASGVQFEEGDIDEPTFHLVQHNYASLRLRFIPDLDWVLEQLQADPADVLQADPEEPLQEVRAFDAWAFQVLGPEATEPEDYPPGSVPPAPGGGAGGGSSYDPSGPKGALYDETPIEVTTTKHTSVKPAKLGPKGDPDAMDWGVSVLQPMITKVITA